MVSISPRSNLDAVRRSLERERRNLAFATARALTWTAQEAKAEVEQSMAQVFDRPTPFTQRGVRIRPATRDRQSSRVFLMPRQAEYLGIQEEGGTRTPSGRKLVVPAGARLNRYGNLPRGAIRRMLGRADTFSGRVRGVPGIWQRRRDGTVKLLVAYEAKATYEPRFGFRDRVRGGALRVFAEKFERSFRQAMETAR